MAGTSGTAGTGGAAGTGGTAGNGPDGGNICPHVVGTADCSPSFPDLCRPTWADVVANPACDRGTAPGTIDFAQEVRFDCNGYHVSQVQHVDTAQTYFYDATTGALVAFYASSNGHRSCVAGPPLGVETNCPSATPTEVCPVDAGAQILPVGP